MTKNSQSQGAWFDTLDPVKMVDDEKVKEQFINTYSKIHRKSIDDATVVWEKESIYYKKAVSGDEKLKKCTNLSLYSAFLEIAIQGLSIQPGQKGEAYLEARSQKVKEGNVENWINICYLRITAYGELNLRILSGQIVRMMNPIVVYEGDLFQPRTQKGELYVDYEPKIPRKSKTIIACWVRIVLPNGINDFKWLTQEDIERLKKYSIPRGGGNSNALYSANGGQIDPGFLEAKTIKHAMRAYTKLRVGDNVMFEEEELEEKDNRAKSGFDENQEEKRTITVDPSKPTEDGKKPIIDDEPF